MKALVVFFVLLLLFVQMATAQPQRGMNINQNLFGSVSQGRPVSETIPLSLADAIDRALKYNLGSIISEQETRVARAARIRSLSDLLPNVTGTVSQAVQQI